MKTDRNLNHEARNPSPQQNQTLASPPSFLSRGRGGGIGAETQLCFGAAGGCFVLGIIGYGINALADTNTTLSAFLVIGGFYALLGVFSLFKREADESSQTANEAVGEEQIEAAA